jgi:hypothetical protein
LLPARKALHDGDGLLSAAFAFDFNLPPAESQTYVLSIPLYPEAFAMRARSNRAETVSAVDAMIERNAASWKRRLVRMPLVIPDEDLMDTARASLAYILINRDGPALQPGSRGYEAAWMRDGALTSAALLRMGYPGVVRMFLDWYAQYVEEDGRVPAIVIIGRDEINPVHEYDSQGQFLFALADYYRFTGDHGLTEALWPRALKALQYLEQLRDSEVQEFYLQHEDQRRYYGILPKSVSHEGYYPEPGNHSYWDNFWALRGWRDARYLARALAKDERLEWMKREEKELREAVYASLDSTMRLKAIDYLPGCAELGDFDPSSTAMAVAVCEGPGRLPPDALEATFERYWMDVRKRNDPAWQGSFSPYEIRIVEALIKMGRRDRALKLLEDLKGVRRPSGWRQWPEAVYDPPRTPGFLGDMPHTWVAAGLLNTLRTLLVYEREADERLVLAAGVPAGWLHGGNEVGLRDAPTAWGTLSCTMKRTRDGWAMTLSGDAAPPGGFEIINPLPGLIAEAAVNDQPATVYESARIEVLELPATVEVRVE